MYLRQPPFSAVAIINKFRSRDMSPLVYPSILPHVASSPSASNAFYSSSFGVWTLEKSAWFRPTSIQRSLGEWSALRAQHQRECGIYFLSFARWRLQIRGNCTSEMLGKLFWLHPLILLSNHYCVAYSSCSSQNKYAVIVTFRQCHKQQKIKTAADNYTRESLE